MKIRGALLCCVSIYTSMLMSSPGLAASQTGIASVYGNGDGYAWRKTASGARMNPHALTAAHRTLPFGTRVTVINKRNGKRVVVQISDRGPFIRGRIIDLSPAAARAIGFSGLAPVKLTI
jgi:rare lipoprotein A